MAKVVEAETVAVWNLDHLLGCRSEMIFHQHVRHAWLLALEPVGSEDKILVSGVGRRLPQLGPQRGRESHHSIVFDPVQGELADAAMQR